MFDPYIPEETLCVKGCGRLATQSVAQDQMSAIHGLFSFQCERCYLEGAIKICEEHAARIPELKRRLAVLAF